MKTFLKLAAALGLAAFVTSSTAFAQGGRGMGGMMGGGLNLLSNKSVQKELKLTDEQIEKAGKAATEQREKMMEKFQELRDLDQGERQEKMQALTKEMMSETKKTVDEILKPEQAKQLQQISYQVQGFGAFQIDEVKSKLKLTDEQNNKIKDMQQEMQDKMQSMRDEFQNDREGMMKKMTEMRNELKDKAVAMLTDDQKKTWKEMTGDKFDYVPEAPRRPGGN